MSSIAYNSELMENIKKNYDQCVAEMDSAVEKFEEMKTGVLTNYIGQGIDIVEESFVKLTEHLQLLRECLLQTGKYVAYTKENAEAEDDALATTWKGNEE